METMTSFLAILIGVLLRLAIPIVGTAMLIYFLRKLDARWQTEAQLQPLPVQNSECWKIKGCSAREQKNCLAKTSSLPCWQIYRLPNGYLREECLSCEVFIDAPIPALRTEPRRM
jgi:hypothetical protein